MRCPLAIAVAFSVLLACEEDSCSRAGECAIVDEAASAGDARAEWAPPSSMSLELNGDNAVVTVVGGEFVFTPDPADPWCTERCTIVVRRFRLRFEEIVLSSAHGEVTVEQLELGFDAPVTPTNDFAAVQVLPAGTEVRACMLVDGQRKTSKRALLEEARLDVRPLSDYLTFDGAIPLTINASVAGECLDFDARLAGFISAKVPWAQRPNP